MQYHCDADTSTMVDIHILLEGKIEVPRGVRNWKGP